MKPPKGRKDRVYPGLPFTGESDNKVYFMTLLKMKENNSGGKYISRIIMGSFFSKIGYLHQNKLPLDPNLEPVQRGQFE